MTMKPTDQAVSRLPLESARAELLEEIIGTPAARRTRPGSPEPMAPRHRRWVIPAAAAAVVAALAASSVLYRSGPGQDSTQPATAGDPSSATPTPAVTGGVPASPAPTRAATVGNEPAAVAADYRAVLRVKGWAVTSTESPQGDFGEVDYGNGARSLTITWYAADSYDSYVEDREHIVDPPAPGEPLEVMGASGQMWAYGPTEHTTIREVRAGHWMEIRGSGMDQAAYTDLLGQLQLVDADGLDAALPAKFVTNHERGATTQTMLTGITDASGSVWPSGQAPKLTSQESDPYQLGAYVAGQYTCAWLADYVNATGSGDTAEAAEAVRVLGTSRQWPVLKDMDAEGDYPEVVWDYADEIAAGQQPTGYQGGLGCH